MQPPSPEWRPPSKEYGGQDIPRYFALMFLNETIAMICAKAKRFDFPVVAALDVFSAEADRIGEELRAQNLYFYDTEGQRDGSVFMDYKLLRNLAYAKVGEEHGANEEHRVEVGVRALKSQITADMTTEQAFEIAQKIVNTWDWEYKTR